VLVFDRSTGPSADACHIGHDIRAVKAATICIAVLIHVHGVCHDGTIKNHTNCSENRSARTRRDNGWTS
jgi:hypothetical protein